MRPPRASSWCSFSGQLVGDAQAVLQAGVRELLRRLGNKIQNRAEAFFLERIHHKVEHLLLVDHVTQPEAVFGDVKPGLRILRPERRKAERRSVMRLLGFIVHVEGHQCYECEYNIFSSSH